MMTKQHPLVRRLIIGSIAIRVRRGGPRLVQHQDLRSDKGAVVPVGDCHDAQRAKQQGKSIHVVICFLSNLTVI